MGDNLAIIRRIIEEHRAIRGHIKLIGDSTSDREAMNALARARADWIPGRQEILSEKQKRLQQTLGFLDEGLKNHFAFEARYLPPLLGELLMRALLLDHGEIRKEIDGAKSMVTDTKLEDLSREDLLSKESRINRIINNLCQVVEEHATNEEILLEMLERALEEKG
jgi:hypothetical protein